ncbi:hypothetical protein D3C72_1453460 [compost metagenome]
MADPQRLPPRAQFRLGPPHRHAQQRGQQHQHAGHAGDGLAGIAAQQVAVEVEQRRHQLLARQPRHAPEPFPLHGQRDRVDHHLPRAPRPGLGPLERVIGDEHAVLMHRQHQQVRLAVVRVGHQLGGDRLHRGRPHRNPRGGGRLEQIRVEPGVQFLAPGDHGASQAH